MNLIGLFTKQIFGDDLNYNRSLINSNNDIPQNGILYTHIDIVFSLHKYENGIYMMSILSTYAVENI